MLQISDLTFAIQGRPLFENANALIASGWKVGLVGRNGTGKSTLLRIIREEIAKPSADSPIKLNQGARLGWVAQEVAASDQTILDVVLACDEERHALMQESETATDPDRIGEIHMRLADIDAWTAESRAAEVLMGLGFTNDDLSRATREFSGGWRMRAAIAGVLFSEPDLLLLDEPTNYLDLEGAAWLEGYIRKYQHTVLIVSHDRDLLNRCVTHTIALEHQKLSLCVGGYDAWMKKRAEQVEQLQSQKAKQDKNKAHLQAFVDRFKAKASKARQAQSRVKMLEKMQDVTIPIEERCAPFNFPGPKDELAPPLLELRDADLGYGEDAKILSDVTLRMDPDDRIAIVGTNGQGKTTLVKSIAKLLPLMAGDVIGAKSIQIGYFSQDQMDELRMGETVLDHIRHALPKDTAVPRQRAVAAAMGFPHEKVETKVEKLSGGEKVRLLLGLTAMEAPHILILDEPTSHLDIDSREALIYGLNDYPGAVLLITHDVYLAEATADSLWLVKDGRAKPYDGDINDYRKLVMQADRAPAAHNADKSEKKSKNSKKPNGTDIPNTNVVSKPEPTSTTPTNTKPAALTKAERDEQKRRASEARKAAAPLKRKAEQAEKALENAQAKIAKIDEELAGPAPSSDRLVELMKERAAQEAIAETSEMDWLEALDAYETAVSEAG
ncbi:ABC-F family ATP-binding cassette domain-containing protein [Hirschia litorea]|uniref:ATP-binding cassette domain-containing protein n=1 Tax=Hirschia litorea TaxID=1199156 RepID=A0ABW2ILF3_9PROT